MQGTIGQVAIAVIDCEMIAYAAIGQVRLLIVCVVVVLLTERYVDRVRVVGVLQAYLV